MTAKLLALAGAEACANRLTDRLSALRCRLESRRFPDDEIYLRVADEVAGDDIVVVAELRNPDPQIPGLLFVADALRELGASGVGLVAPYLPYMRQDSRFRPGEAVTSRSFARLVSAAFDWLVTVDPHLHRHASLGSIYSIPATVAASAPEIAAWVRIEVGHPYLIGPDEESEQWISEVATLVGCPWTVLRKRRLSDREVLLELPDLAVEQGGTPVLVDDIVASAGTMARAVLELRAAGCAPPVCIGVHAVYAGNAATRLKAAGAARVVSCNTLSHASNAIDVTGPIAAAVRMSLQGACKAAGNTR